MDTNSALPSPSVERSHGLGIEEKQQSSHIRSPAVDASPASEQDRFTDTHSFIDVAPSTEPQAESESGGNTEELDILSEIQAAIDETERRRSEEMEEFDTSFNTIVPTSNEEPDAVSPMTQQGYFDIAQVEQPSASRSPKNRASTYMAREASTRSIQPLKDITNTPSQIQLQKLTRVRPLSAAAECSDIKKLKTSLERANAYAIKINALSKEDTGLHAWLATKAKSKPDMQTESYRA